MDEIIVLIKEYGNYVFYCMLVCGNEFSGCWVEWVIKFVEYWEKKDFRYVYIGVLVGNGW